MIVEVSNDKIEDIVVIEQELFLHPWTKAQFLYELNENTFARMYMYIENGEVLGYIDMWITFEMAQLAKIAVTKRAHRRGIAHKMMKFMIAKCEEHMCENITLEVRVENVAAIRLYEAYGFLEVTRKIGYYADGMDAIYMIKPLGGSYI